METAAAEHRVAQPPAAASQQAAAVLPPAATSQPAVAGPPTAALGHMGAAPQQSFAGDSIFDVVHADLPELCSSIKVLLGHDDPYAFRAAHLLLHELLMRLRLREDLTVTNERGQACQISRADLRRELDTLMRVSNAKAAQCEAESAQAHGDVPPLLLEMIRTVRRDLQLLPWYRDELCPSEGDAR
jgi:hypothetical protein